MVFENNVHWYLYKYLERNIMWIYFSVLLLTLNVPLRIANRTPGGYMYPRLGTPTLTDREKLKYERNDYIRKTKQ